MVTTAFIVVAMVSVSRALSAPTAIAPPVAVKDQRPALSIETVGQALENQGPSHVFDTFAGKNEALRGGNGKHSGLFVADGFPVGLSAAELFDVPFPSDGRNAFTCSITSLDAFALRLKLDLSLLGPDDEVFVIDATAARAFGPYTRSDVSEAGEWLATTFGDTCVLLVRSPDAEAPLLTVLGLSHFYEDLEAQRKELGCNNDIDCDNDDAIEESSTGVGMLIVPQGDFFQALCSGALINNADTPSFEPYFLTSWHCVPDAADVNQVEVLWDWRADSCGGGDPSISGLPRSEGKELLRTSSFYDITLIELDDVPSGDLGRAYLGWETRDPIEEEEVVTIHFPVASPMKISYGNVKEIDQNSGGFTRQTKVHWEDGVTEGGSSGGPLLLADEDYRIAGTLSNGPQHSCLSTGGNVDWYSSFRDFLPLIEDYLTGDAPPIDPPTAPTSCAAEKAFPGNATVLDALRIFRDNGLKQTAIGNTFIDFYYDTAPVTASAVEHSASLRWLVRGVALPVAIASKTLWGTP